MSNITALCLIATVSILARIVDLTDRFKNIGTYNNISLLSVHTFSNLILKCHTRCDSSPWIFQFDFLYLGKHFNAISLVNVDLNIRINPSLCFPLNFN